MSLERRIIVEEEINNLILELQQTTYKYGCLMLKYKVTKTWWDSVQALIDEEDIVRVNGKYGRERWRDAHVTIMYGLHEGVDKDEIAEAVNEYMPKDIKVNKLSYFEGPSYDVIKFEVDYVFFKLMNKKMKQFPNTKTHNTYKPHMTVCYVKKGKGRKYAETLPTKLIKNLKPDEFELTDKYGNKKFFDYRKK